MKNLNEGKMDNFNLSDVICHLILSTRTSGADLRHNEKINKALITVYEMVIRALDEIIKS